MQFIRTFLIPIIVILALVDMLFFRFLFKHSRMLGMSVYIIVVLCAVEYYSYIAYRNVAESSLTLWAYILIHFLLYGAIIYFMITKGRDASDSKVKIGFVVLTLFIIPKIFLALTFILDDILRFGNYFLNSVNNNDAPSMPSRRKAVTWIGLGIAAIPFLGVLDGVLRGKYRFRVIRKTLFFDDLPEEFDGFTITQISDVHSGSFDDVEKVDYGVKMALNQKSDVLVFTGDMVNNEAKEFVPYQNIFSQLEAQEGMYATLGNHDYGDYGDLTEEEKAASIQHLQQMQREIGFVPLNNEMRTIERNGKRLNIVGVENWGHSHYFPKRGDLKKATKDIRDGDFNVLLSHDPSHFDHDLEEYDNVVDFEKKMHLTLSGHTHGMQFGIEIPGLIKWSPVKYRYHNWAGLYEQNGRKLYVNRGFGYLAFPGRVGIWPEITVLELRKKT